MTVRHFIVPAYLVLCIVLGGASRAGYLANFVLQLLALPIIVAALMKPRIQMSRAARALTWLTAALVVLMLVQLAPLPPSAWASLPGREPIAEGYRMLGQPLPWLPLTLAPDRALASLLWLLPAFAVLLGTLRLGAYRGTLVAWSLAGVTVVAVMIGAMQITGGNDSPFYFYAVTNWGNAVGFFANSNHMATLLLCTIPFLAALHVEASKSKSVRRASGVVVMLAGVALILLVGLVINRSLAGLGLAVPVIAASFLLFRYRRGALPLWAPAAAGLLTVAAVAAVYMMPLGSDAFSDEARSGTDSRSISVATTLKAARAHLPFGSGVGSFEDIYRLSEDPRSVERVFMNHAHSDFAEVALEAGIPGLLLLLVFLICWPRRAARTWRTSQRPDHFARAATIASAAVIAHSLVDYPLRTAAISVVFAICLALMAEPRPVVRTSGAKDDEGVRHLSA